MEKDKFNYIEAAQKLTNEKSVWRQIGCAIKNEMFPCPQNRSSSRITLFLSTVAAVVLARSENTVSLAQEICGIFLDVHMAIFGCIFAVYSILLAFMSDSYIKKLLKIGYNDKVSYLQVSTQYYESALYIYFAAICMSLTYKIGTECMPLMYVLTDNDTVNMVLAFILLWVYFLYAIRSVLELKSVIGNTLLLFRTSLQFKILTFEEDKTRENQSND